ncbi:class I SAM-dependent methyltransferase [Sphingosinicella sp. BN140058]|uniref:class I SAM-dependent methyltransferase n=1 Tax=Sphingosinicella sp. BN140058 TaxID=1892855 RepID=UPI001012E1C8|nr:class I SAM-dependent methyltransferase [Sphingosinicella sp. BN140058]QAY76254.1 class I SAM-dependent methyltransferase [Sphingosinicella sp. BN140058]
MTTRDATGLLPRIGETPVIDASGDRSAGDWAALLAYGAITWPWLLKGLSGGSEAQRRHLLHRLDLPADALPNLGSWKADAGLLTLIVDHILANRPRLVVEFGTGASTLVIARALQKAGGGRLISFEQHADFVDATRRWLSDHGLEADLRAVPLRPSPDGWPGLWYAHGPLPHDIDMMLIDGPPWTIHPLTRGAAASLFDHIAPGGTLFLDDAARPGERIVARRWRKARPDFDFRMWKGGTKGTLIATRR